MASRTCDELCSLLSVLSFLADLLGSAFLLLRAVLLSYFRAVVLCRTAGGARWCHRCAERATKWIRALRNARSASSACLTDLVSQHQEHYRALPRKSSDFDPDFFGRAARLETVDRSGGTARSSESILRPGSAVGRVSQRTARAVGRASQRTARAVGRASQRTARAVGRASQRTARVVVRRCGAARVVVRGLHWQRGRVGPLCVSLCGRLQSAAACVGCAARSRRRRGRRLCGPCREAIVRRGPAHPRHQQNRHASRSVCAVRGARVRCSRGFEGRFGERPCGAVSRTGVRRGLARTGVRGGLARTVVRRGLARTGVRRGLARTGVRRGLARTGVRGGLARTVVRRGLARTGVRRGLARRLCGVVLRGAMHGGPAGVG